MRASSSSEVDDTTLDWRRAGNTGGCTLSGLDGPSESWRWNEEGLKNGTEEETSLELRSKTNVLEDEL